MQAQILSWLKQNNVENEVPSPFFPFYIRTNKEQAQLHGTVTLQTQSEVSLIIETEDGGIR